MVTTTEQLTVLLAQRVLGWQTAPNRFLTTGRQWTPRWHFRPTESISDAFRLLEAAKPQEYSMGAKGSGEFRVSVRIAGRTGEAHDTCKPLAIATAIARAIGVDVE